MIIDTLNNLHKYSPLFREVNKLLDVLKNKSLPEISEKVCKGDITLIPLRSEGVSENFDPTILESHKALMDIHITLEGLDVIAFADLENETRPVKDYDDANDYSLSTSETIKILSVPAGYFCIIPNNFAHMALYKGHIDVKKIVVKMPVKA
ncbi:MAG: YhcH/YjgK/YiaL family protein [Algoriphagus sp.]|jgi:YhcH/YjgK/YiaL family protein